MIEYQKQILYSILLQVKYDHIKHKNPLIMF